MLSWIKLQYLSLMQERLIFQPKHKIIEPLRSPDYYDLFDMKDGFIYAEDGVSLYVWHQEAQKGQPTILFWQGNSGHVADVGPPKPGEIYYGDYRLRFVRELLDEGYGVVIPCPRGFGNSQKIKPSESGMWLDAKRLNEFCHNELNVPSDKLILVGESLGACSALMSASDMKSRYNNTPLVAMIAPFHSIGKKIEENHKDVPLEKAVAKLRHTLDNSDFLSQLDDNTHVLVITPGDDQTTSPWHSELLVEHIATLNIPHNHHILEEAGHITWKPRDVVGLIREAYDSLRRFGA